ncbi:MAG: DNA topoisomerase I [Dehalococcoides mccartyi]|nr:MULTISPECIES: type I DNA topoisomerase [Dehalococcoides]AGG06312.1 DNA topoisomerase I [Dehalococcoides mccartyi DCMB5]OBW63275.1 MAG: DNA topoisomerase I [Dehalococcoides mccartyi]PKH45235.1 DNA topoisomerase I [Dehalococcoides mccartyi]
MKEKLVIVESPAKARTISKMLGKDFNIMATMGHIRDLPKSTLGVDVENNFTPKYVSLKAKAKVIKELKEAVKNSKAIYLATDPDREGEAIAWHISEVTKANLSNPKRVVFHEITKEAIDKAFKNTRELDMDLVNAQQARRVLDRLVGYKLSPLLWRKVQRGLSAGRVQSVSLKIIVDREREIEKFVSTEYWNIEALLSKKVKSAAFKATLAGYVTKGKLEIHNESEADQIKKELEVSDYQVLKIKRKSNLRQSPAPFITSTLQQEAWRKLRFSAKQTMVIAQQLYEGLNVEGEGEVGLITYMRTDSTNVARTAVAETRDYITEKYGPAYLPKQARVFSSKVKGAQEAHEAIRPTRINRTPDFIKKSLSADQFKLYQLIWQRMMASQMSPAVFDNTTIDIEAKHQPSKTRYLLRTTSSVNTFPGFTIVYIEGKDEDEEKEQSSLPPMEEGEELKLKSLDATQHFTQPPPRYTEATLIKALEQNGIGRPSTYAPTISTIQEREYITKLKGSLKPSELGMLVNDLLVEHFPDIIGIDFTAAMEAELDKIATEKLDWVPIIRRFYEPFIKEIEAASEKIEKIKPPEEELDELCPECNAKLVIKRGRFGKFIACSRYSKEDDGCRYTRSYQIKTGAKCPDCNSDIVEKYSKKGKIFYGCAGYPNCKFVSFYKPLTKPCPECGALMTKSGQNWAKCTKCGKRKKLEDES